MIEALADLTRRVLTVERNLARTAVIEKGTAGGSGAPVDASYVVMGTNATLTNERVLTGTANQIIVGDGGAGGNVTLSLAPNVIITGITLSGLTANRLVYTTTGGQLATDAVLTYNSVLANQVLISNGYLQVNQKTSAAADAPAAFVVIGANNTGVTTGLEQPSVYFGLGHTVQWAGATPGEQREVLILFPTYSSNDPSGHVIADAATVAITGMPSSGANVTILRSWSLWVQSGAVRFENAGLILGSASTQPGSGEVIAGGPFSVGSNAAAVGSSILDLTSTSRGAVLPRMTEAQRDAIGTPTEALIVYNLDDNEYNFHDGTNWVPFGGGSGTVTGTGVAGQVAFWSAPTVIAGDTDFTFNGAQLALAVQGVTGGVLAGGDALWYRNAANEWRTPDSVVVDGTLYVGSDKKFVFASVGGVNNTISADPTAASDTLIEINSSAPASQTAIITWVLTSNVTSGGMDARINDAGAKTLAFFGFNTFGIQTAALANAYSFTTIAGETVFNEQGLDINHRFEGDTATNLLVLDAGLDAVQIGTTVAGALADFRSTVVVFNEPGNDVDYRFEGDTNTTLLSLDAGLDAVGVGTSPSAGVRLTTTITGASASDLYALSANSTNSSTAFAIGQLIISNTSVATPTTSSGALGLFGNARMTGSGTATTVTGLRFNSEHRSSGVITNMYGMEVGVVFTSTGDATSGTGIKVELITISSGGVSGTAVGLDILGVTAVGAATAIAIRTNGGNLQFGGTAATLVGFRGATPVAAPDYTVTNPATDRAFDSAAALIAEVRNVLGTVIADLIALGIFQ